MKIMKIGRWFLFAKPKQPDHTLISFKENDQKVVSMPSDPVVVDNDIGKSAEEAFRKSVANSFPRFASHETDCGPTPPQ